MELLVFSTPRWFRGNDTSTRWNPDVVGPGIPWPPEDGRWWRRVAQLRVLGKSPVRAFLRLNQRLWSALPSSAVGNRAIQGYGRILHRLACAQGDRSQALSTFFLRNQPELELIRRLASRAPYGQTLRVAVLGCSTGAEAYSVAWTIKSARPDLKLALQGVDISAEAVEYARRGVYSKSPSDLTGTAVLDRMSAEEVKQVFDEDEGRLAVKSWIREGIRWSTGDAGDPGLVERLGPQDVVIANNFLCHMQPGDAERFLHNIARLVPNGHLFVGGIDLDVRSRVARRLGWEPVDELLEEIHDGDPCLREQWPCQYAGLEPLDKSRKDWKLRYASAFRIVGTETAPSMRAVSEAGETANAK
jgi:chemotaxis methyl-accepting protein methylase